MSRVLSYAIQLKDEASDAQDKMGEGLDKLHGKFMGIPTSALAAGAAIAGVGAAAIALGKTLFDLGDEMDSAFDKIRIGTGATGDALEALKQTTRDVVSDVPTDLDKASTATTGFAQRLGLAGEPLRALSGDILELSRLTGTDLNENIKSSSQLMRSWGVDQDQQRETLNQLLRAYQATGVAVTDLGRGVNDMGPIFRQMGLSMSESIALTAGLEREGVNAEAVVRGMNTAIAKLAQAGQDASTALPDLLATIRDMESSSEATGLAVDLFGSRAGPRLAEAIRAGRLEIGELLDSIEEGTETIPDLAAATEDAAEIMVKAWAEVKDAAAPFAEVVFNLATTLAKEVRPRIVEFRDDLDSIRRLFEIMANAVPRLAGQIADAVGNMAGAIANTSSLGKAAQVGGIDLADMLGVGIVDVGKSLAEGTANIAGELADEFGNAAEAVIRTLVEAGRESIADAADDGAGELADAMEEGVQRATRTSRLSGGTALSAAQLAALGLGPKAAAGGAGASGAAVKAEAERIVETAIDGFMAAMAANRANLQDRFGEVGASAASALETGIVENTKSAGAAAFREVENIVLKLQKENVPEWRELGDDLAGVFHTALVSRLDSDKEAAFQKLEEIRDLIRQRNALTPQNLMESLDAAISAQSLGSGAGIMQSLEKAWAEGGEQNRKALAQQAASWIGEVQRGLDPDRASQIVAQFTDALAAAAEDNGDEARAAMEDIFRSVRLEIPKAALDKTLNDALETIERARVEARAAAQESRDISDDAARRRGDLKATQDVRLRDLTSSFPDDRAKQAEDAAKKIAEAQQKGQEAVNDARFRGDTLATLRAMKAAEDQVKKLQEQTKEQESQFGVREARERQIAGLRDVFARENDELNRTLQDEALARQLEQIDRRAAKDRETAETRYTEGIENLNRTLGLVDQIGQSADHMFDGSLLGIQAVVAEARTLADALGISVPGGLPNAAPGAGVGLDENGNVQSLTPGSRVNIGTLNVTNNGYMGEGGPEALMAEAVEAEESLLQ